MDIRWAALFSANWRFAQQQTDYLAQDRDPSPVLHYWSLGVEEQFYFVWPILVLVLGWLALRTSRRFRPVVGVVMAVVTIASFVWCLHLTGVDQPYAFFATTSRAWQLGVGAVLAALLPLVALGRRARVWLGLVGALGYVVALFTLSEAGIGDVSYPGYLALLPTFAAAALLAAGTGETPTLMGRALSVRPLTFVGDLSYSWYLWHWPVLVLAPLVLGSDSAAIRTGAVVLSFGLAWLSYVALEQPLRTAPWLARNVRRSFAMGALCIGLAIASTVPLANMAAPQTVLGMDGKPVVLRPSLAAATGDAVALSAFGCALDYEQTVPDPSRCVFGATDGAKTVVLVGDSHAGAFFPALDEAAKREGWRLVALTKNACPVADVTKFDLARRAVFTECDDFRRWMVDYVATTKPDLVVVVSAWTPTARVIDRATGEKLPVSSTPEQLQQGLRSVVSGFSAAGVPTLVVEDLARAATSPVDCLATYGRVDACLVRFERTGEPEAVDGIADVSLFDLKEGLCDATTCLPVVGDVLVYRDTNHMTKTYALTLTDRVAAELSAVS